MTPQVYLAGQASTVESYYRIVPYRTVPHRAPSCTCIILAVQRCTARNLTINIAFTDQAQTEVTCSCCTVRFDASCKVYGTALTVDIYRSHKKNNDITLISPLTIHSSPSPGLAQARRYWLKVPSGSVPADQPVNACLCCQLFKCTQYPFVMHTPPPPSYRKGGYVRFQ